MVKISSRLLLHIRRLVLVMLLLCCGVAQSGAVENAPHQLSNPQWLQLPTDSLSKLGGYYLNKKNIPDSAYLCYSIIIDRYHENKLKKEELKQRFDCCPVFFSLVSQPLSEQFCFEP